MFLNTGTIHAPDPPIVEPLITGRVDRYHKISFHSTGRVSLPRVMSEILPC